MLTQIALIGCYTLWWIHWADDCSRKQVCTKHFQIEYLITQKP